MGPPNVLEDAIPTSTNGNLRVLLFLKTKHSTLFILILSWQCGCMAPSWTSKNSPLICYSWRASHFIDTMALHVGANQYTGPVYIAPTYYMVVGNIFTTVNQARQAGSISSLCKWDVYGLLSYIMLIHATTADVAISLTPQVPSPL